MYERARGLGVERAEQNVRSVSFDEEWRRGGLTKEKSTGGRSWEEQQERERLTLVVLTFCSRSWERRSWPRRRLRTRRVGPSRRRG